MKYPYNKKIKHLSKFDKELAVLYDSFDGLNQHDNVLTCIFKIALSDNEKLSLDNLVNNFVDTPDEILEKENQSFNRKKAGQRFDDFTIAVLTSDGFADTVDIALLKYQVFALVRTLIKDGLFHYALRVFVRDIMPAEGLTTGQKTKFLNKLRMLCTKYYPDEDLAKIEAGE